MVLRTRRTAFYLALVLATTVLFTLVYNTGMAVWEGRPQPLYRSLEVVVQSFTTTGYGEDAGWQSPQMNLLVITMQLAGIGLILTGVDVFAVPWLREAVTPTPPESIDVGPGHVVICAYTARTEAFITELEARGRAYVLVEPDADTARELHDEGYRVIHGDPESTAALENARIGTAETVVADSTDDANASIVLAARDANPDVRAITLVTDTDLARYHRAAGADEVLSPRQILGRSLIGEIPTAVATDVDDGVTLGEDFELVEVTVAADSDVCDRRFTEVNVRERFGVNVIGAWIGTDFETPVDPEMQLDAGTRLLVVGAPDRIETFREATAAAVRTFPSQRIVLAGYGDSGRAAYEALARTGSRVTVLDSENVDDGDVVDVVGDARDPAVLEAAEISEASVLVLTIGDDTTAIFTTLIARELNPDLDIVVRANDDANVEKLYRAGADYVQSLATVSGRMLASTVFEDEEVLAYDKRINVVRLPAGSLGGSTIADADVRGRTGCTIVAVVRGGAPIHGFDPHTFQIEADDELILVGTDDDVIRFEREFVE
ncbi:potassium channel family protein [Halopenitus persicus]|uniref:Trk K+ transport system, NAD-binding component n=1 Tax=Halopenitus persicus TaxID=1048396 RepID=A0A1H3M9W6_9EURY|nr:NAD-binding protein [Halopenitus persicus]SDY73078.1 Trk K+ transport system, NAD-binding component [Halopenitus persicus]